MKKFLFASAILLAFAVTTECRWGQQPPPPPGPPLPPTPATPDTEPTAEPPTEAPPETRTIPEQVLDMVQEGIDGNGSVLGLYSTCLGATYSQEFSSKCGDDTESYYEEVDYDEDWKIIITSGAPDHPAEEQSTPFCTQYTDLCKAINPLIDEGRLNPNKRCEKWQYVILPKNPQLTGKFADTPMGATGFAISGGHIYNHLANPDGSVAWYYEIQSLDLSMGHSDPDGNYHYHGVPYLIPDASDSSSCTKIGYLFDGFPVHGQCEDEDGNEMISCYKLIDGRSGDNVADYEYDEAGFAAGTCHLDMANGRTFDDGYRYVTTTNFPGIPMFYSGQSIPRACGFCPEEKGFC